MKNSELVKTNVNWWSCQQLQCYLERHGFAVYDDELTEDLREAVKENMFKGGGYCGYDEEY